jgi:hypothetical protein
MLTRSGNEKRKVLGEIANESLIGSTKKSVENIVKDQVLFVAEVKEAVFFEDHWKDSFAYDFEFPDAKKYDGFVTPSLILKKSEESKENNVYVNGSEKGSNKMKKVLCPSSHSIIVGEMNIYDHQIGKSSLFSPFNLQYNHNSFNHLEEDKENNPQPRNSLGSSTKAFSKTPIASVASRQYSFIGKSKFILNLTADMIQSLSQIRDKEFISKIVNSHSETIGEIKYIYSIYKSEVKNFSFVLFISYSGSSFA